MTQVSESVSSRRALSERALAESFPERAAQPNIQELFLNHARRDRITVTVHLMSGRTFDARIKSFDKFAVVLDVEGADHLVFKHAIATIESPRAIANYFAAQHP
jgi:host factor-I protein